MEIKELPFTVTDWNQVPVEEVPGETGISLWKAFEGENIRIRMVEYSPGFSSDHWCPRGHVLLCLEGEFLIKLKDAREFKLLPGMSFQAGDDEENPHWAWSEKGAKVFIVD